MTRIDFYVLSDSNTSSLLELTCKLAEKACNSGEKVFIYSMQRALLETLDERLWDFRPMSFIAHRLLPETDLMSSEDNDPLLLSSSEPGIDRSLLINLDNTVPAFFSRFERTLEVVNSDPDVQAAGRERYRFYNERGYPLKHHKIQ